MSDIRLGTTLDHYFCFQGRRQSVDLGRGLQHILVVAPGIINAGVAGSDKNIAVRQLTGEEVGNLIVGITLHLHRQSHSILGIKLIGSNAFFIGGYGETTQGHQCVFQGATGFLIQHMDSEIPQGIFKYNAASFAAVAQIQIMTQRGDEVSLELLVAACTGSE